jgi:orotidine-5'-phosphate decarboxylase
MVADRASQWNKYGNVGLVVGATYPEELKLLREIYPEMMFLIPGIGAQGGDLGKTVRNGADLNGRGIIINSARQIIYASRGADFATAARKAAMDLRDSINSFL